MNIPVLTFFNNKGGVGKTSLVYHLSWMFAEMRKKVVVLDLDPQANLTAAFLDDEQLESLWEGKGNPTTIYRVVKPLTAFGDLAKPKLWKLSSHLHLMPGDVALSGFEETLSEAWPQSMSDRNLYRPFRILTAFWQVGQMAAKDLDADIILADVGPNLGAINRSVLIGSDFVVIPLGADLFSLQGLQNLGPTLQSWRSLWQKRLNNWAKPEFDLPSGAMKPLGYLIQQYSIRLSRPITANDRWVNRMPNVYHESLLGEMNPDYTPENDPACLARLRHYRSLVPLAQEARKPIFKLTPADGAIGAHATAVQEANSDFRKLATEILARIAKS